MADYVTKIRTTKGDLQIDFNSLANRPSNEAYITADEREYWNQKMNPTDILSDESAALYGLENGASSDDVFSFLGKYNQHWWKLVTNSRVTKYEEQRRAFAEEYDENIHLYKKSGTIFYADDYTINEDTGDIYLVNKSQMSADDDWSILYGKYIQSTDGGITATNYTDNIEENVVDVIYHSGNPYIVYENESGTNNFKPGIGYAATHDGNESFGVILAISYILNVGDVEYKYSARRNEYPDSGTVDGITYDYLGIPFDNMSQSSKIDIKIGDLKHSFETDQGEDWMLADGAKLSHTEYPEIGNILKDNHTIMATKVNGEYSSWCIRDVVCVNGLYVGVGYVKTNSSKYYQASIFHTNDIYGAWDVLMIDNTTFSLTDLDRISYGNGQYVVYSSANSSYMYASISPKTSWEKIIGTGSYIDIVYGNGYWVLVHRSAYTSNSYNKTSCYYTSNIFNGFDSKTYVEITAPASTYYWGLTFNNGTWCMVTNDNSTKTYVITSEDLINGPWTTTTINNFYGRSVQYINDMYVITGAKYVNSKYNPGFAISNSLTEGWNTISIIQSNNGKNSYDLLKRPIAYDEISNRWAVVYAIGSSTTDVYLSEDSNLEGTWSVYKFATNRFPSNNLFFNNNRFAYIYDNTLISNEYFTLPALHNATNGYSTYIKIR